MWGFEVVVHSRRTGLAVVGGAAIECGFCPIGTTLRRGTTGDVVNVLVGSVADLVVDSVVDRLVVDSVVDPVVDTVVVDSVVVAVVI